MAIVRLLASSYTKQALIGRDLARGGLEAHLSASAIIATGSLLQVNQNVLSGTLQGIYNEVGRVIGNASQNHTALRVRVASNETAIALKAPSASPTFTGNVVVPTQAANDSSTKAASTAFVMTELADYATLAAPTLTGVPAAPTAASGTNSTQLATTAFVHRAVNLLGGGSLDALNTLKELGDALGSNATMSSSLATKITALNASDAALQVRATKLENTKAHSGSVTRLHTSLGCVSSAGVFQPFEGLNYISAQTSLSGVVNVLVDSLYTVESGSNGLAQLHQRFPKSGDTKFVARKQGTNYNLDFSESGTPRIQMTTNGDGTINVVYTVVGG
jgi:hypothetical protein